MIQELLKYKVEADLDNYCSQIENAHGIIFIMEYKDRYGYEYAYTIC